MLAPILDEPETQIAILTFDSQLNLAQDFTSDADTDRQLPAQPATRRQRSGDPRRRAIFAQAAE